MYNPVDQKLRDQIRKEGRLVIKPKKGWESFTIHATEKNGFVNIPYIVRFTAPRPIGASIMRDITPGFLRRCDIETGVIMDIPINNVCYKIFEAELSLGEGAVCIEDIKPVKESGDSDALKYDARFFEAFLYELLDSTRQKIDAQIDRYKGVESMYADSNIPCFPDVLLELGYQIRAVHTDRLARGTYRRKK